MRDEERRDSWDQVSLSPEARLNRKKLSALACLTFRLLSFPFFMAQNWFPPFPLPTTQVFMLNAFECESRGFCWAVHEVPGVPWCYWKEGEGIADDSECDAGSSSRRECATPGKPINEKTCRARGCCWRSGEQGQPWCFHPGASGSTPKPKPKAPVEPEQPREPLPPATTPRFIRPTPPPPGWVPGAVDRGVSGHSEL